MALIRTTVQCSSENPGSWCSCGCCLAIQIFPNIFCIVVIFCLIYGRILEADEMSEFMMMAADYWKLFGLCLLVSETLTWMNFLLWTLAGVSTISLSQLSSLTVSIRIFFCSVAISFLSSCCAPCRKASWPFSMSSMFWRKWCHVRFQVTGLKTHTSV